MGNSPVNWIDPEGLSPSARNLYDVDGVMAGSIGGGGSARGVCSVSKPNPPIWSATATKTPAQNAFSHWLKHKMEFPELQNSKQYVDAAKSFFSSSLEGVLSKIRSNGDVLLFNPTTNTFGSRTSDGAPKTMFRPTDGIDYWRRQ